MKVEEKWYFDSGSSRHMTGNKEFLTNLQPCSLEPITFGDGGKGKILGCGSLKVLGMTKLENILLMGGLKVKLISISQLCDDNLFVYVTPQRRGSVDYPSTRGNTCECRVTRHFSRKSGRVSFVRGALPKYKTCIYLSQTVQYIQYIQSHE